ncbi:hypothetical protein AYR46_18035 [Sphingobium yanoikuyae]|uniref:DUF3800 domain-containing protein n=1 Tax=Sphingobium yanoikuyae TaxID=13690 RepID=UPI0007A757A0|nr:DUF3800 domain-containing protein [Sphingobium yanoikuyae]KZC77277.1 hypothetical protein AYR46_18035 [Sphingobium yanoikuyae]
MSLRFYIDDSGKNDPPVFVLGGVAFQAEQVASFEAEWIAELASPPAIPFLKMKDANAGRGAFKGVPRSERDAKLARLGEILRKYATATVAVIVRHDDYERIFSGKMMAWMDRPYQMMFHLTIATAYKLVAEHGFGKTAEFVFDRQIEHETALRESYPALRQGMEPALAAFLPENPRHADDQIEVALQAADMIAWHVRRTWRDGTDAMARASGAGPSIVAIPGKHDLFTEKTLAFLASVATSTVRRLNTVFPYEAKQIGEDFEGMATYANLQLIAEARPLQPVELISFPATGTGTYQLVRSCAALGRPHLHRQSGTRCLGEASAA